MVAMQYNYLERAIQDEIDRLEKMEEECAKNKDYASATVYYNHRLGLQHAWYIIVNSEITYK